MAPNSPEQIAASAWRFHQMGRLGEAIDLYRQAAALAPGYAEIHNNLGNALLAAGRTEEAVASLKRAAKLKPSLAGAHTNLGLALAALGRFEDAAESHRAALKLQPRLAMAHNNLGVALQKAGKLDEAIPSFRRAIELDSRLPEAWVNLADALRLMEPAGESQDDPRRQARLEEALLCYRSAIALRSNYAEAYGNLGALLTELKRLDEAAACLARAHDLDPADARAIVDLAFTRRRMCDWRGEADVESVAKAILSIPKGSMGYFALVIADDPQLHLDAARREASFALANRKGPAWPDTTYRHQKIRLGYLSADFRTHAVASLAARLFELHDRSRFQLHAFSIGPNDRSAMNDRLRHAFDTFNESGPLSDQETAQQIRRAEIDILVDLTGYTKHARPGIAAYRPAPIQVSYLGYPGTMGASFFDYAIVDPFIVPESQQFYFDEKLVYLPHSYQVNDSRRVIAERTPSRADCGLPERGFVFCCFNNNHKISPAMFSLWMELLQAAPGSVLWLLADNPWVAENLRREAASRRVDPGRLVFAGRALPADHLARHRLADLFIDTLPYNAHTTASDALWAGLPVLTCTGTSFPARVAGSLLHAIGLPELVTASIEDYKAKALGFARQPEMLAAVREKLARNRLTMPLFDSARSCRDIEAAYFRMWTIHQEKQEPHGFSVSPAN